MPLKNNIKSKKGFTIIEVVLVLAIAGLIFLMVFLALPAMQRSRKDTQRRDQLSDLVAQITQYQANNRNRLPSCTDNNKGCDVTITDSNGTITVGGTGLDLNSSSSWAGFYKNYLITDGDVFEDPNGNPYNLEIVQCTTTETVTSQCAKQRYNAEFYKAADSEGNGAGQNYKVLVTTNSVCEGEVVVPSSGTRKVTVAYKLEGGGTFCQGN